jgi:hypothetical protein
LGRDEEQRIVSAEVTQIDVAWMPPFTLHGPVDRATTRLGFPALKEGPIRSGEACPKVFVAVADRTGTAVLKPASPDRDAIGLEIPPASMGTKDAESIEVY